MSKRNSEMPIKRYFLPIFVFFLIPVTLIVLHSCNKQDQTTTKSDQDQRSNELDAIRQRINRDGLTITVPVHQKLETFFTDSMGNRISDAVRLKQSVNRKATASITSSCDFFNVTTVTLGSYSLTSFCQTGLTITWNYTISSNNNIVITSPVNSSLQSKGVVRIFTSSNTQIYSATPVVTSVNDLGLDSSNAGYELFAVSIQSAPIPFANFANGNIVKLGASMTTDCPDIESFPVNISEYALNGNGGAAANACDRLDPIQVPNSSAPLRFYGEDPGAVCAPTYGFPNLHEIQYSTDGGVSWNGEFPTATLNYFLPPTTSTLLDSIVNKHLGYVDPGGALELNLALPPGTYNLKVRHRNIMFNNPATFYPGGKWPVPVFGVNANCCFSPWSDLTSYSVTY